ncbi:MAG: membrane protein insertase YidC [Propionibacteriaceae bacterium]|jgi:YidC/Oxa1 family membrane protein insertase|nr:membrane protein insertase YidC [Propionibacteriaceae bacterium]
MLLTPLDIFADLGSFFSTILAPIYWLMSWILMAFHWVVSRVLDPNAGVTWALSIVLLTMVVRACLIPLFVKQIRSARNMQLIGPKVKALQDKYGSDRERLGQETMKLYKEEGVNPMASCFPILAQMPIFLSLFWVLSEVSNGQYKGVFADDHPLADSLRNAELFGAKISQTFMPRTGGWQGWTNVQTLALVLIVLMVICLFITQLQLMRKNMPPEAQTGPMAQQQKMMLYMFPLIYAIGGINIPIGVLVYWLTTNLWTMGQQYILIHNNPAPNTPAYIDWEERMKAKGKDPDAIAAARAGRGRKVSTTPGDPNVVARQRPDTPARQPKPGTAKGGSKPGGGKVGGSTADPKAAVDGQAESSSESVKKVVRRQPPKQSRAKRKNPPK